MPVYGCLLLSWFTDKSKVHADTSKNWLLLNAYGVLNVMVAGMFLWSAVVPTSTVSNYVLILQTTLINHLAPSMMLFGGFEQNSHLSSSVSALSQAPS